MNMSIQHSIAKGPVRGLLLAAHSDISPQLSYKEHWSYYARSHLK